VLLLGYNYGDGIMSGGSYNYLCHKEFSGHSSMDDLDSMVDRLAGLGYAEDAAKESMELLLIIKQFEVRAETIANRLNGVWKAVEWWDSCDSDEERVKEALEMYRK
jgi:hypothetical protein